MYFIIKILISAIIIASVSELGKRSSLAAAVLASLPLTSILAMTWLYRDTQDTNKVVLFSKGVFWAVLPSLVFFIVFPILIKTGLNFKWAMLASSVVMIIAYTIYVAVLGRAGINP